MRLKKLRTLALNFLLFVAVMVAAYLLLRVIMRIPEEHWHLAGEISRNTNALAVLAASIAAYIAWNTNRARAQEAIRSDFKDRIQWASLNYASEDPMQAELAEMTIFHFSTSDSLSEEDSVTAKRLAKRLERVREAENERWIFLRNHISSMTEEFSRLDDTFKALPQEAKLWLVQTQRLNSAGFQQLSFEYDLAALELGVLPTLDNINQVISILGRLNELLDSALRDWREHVNHNRPDSGD